MYIDKIVAMLFESITFKFKIIYFLILVIGMLSCNKLRQKGEEVIDKTKNVASEQVDKVFPTYDAYKPDTDNNKKRFKEHLQIGLTNDIKNIYTFGDFFGVDYKVLIAFSCDTITINKIIKTKKMHITESKDDDGLFFMDELNWWDKNKIELLTPYKVGEEYKYWQYLWYNEKTKQAYYEEFSL